MNVIDATPIINRKKRVEENISNIEDKIKEKIRDYLRNEGFTESQINKVIDLYDTLEMFKFATKM
jgi:uncharacterized protein (UPF0335 family)